MEERIRIEKPFRDRLASLEATSQLLESSKLGDIDSIERILFRSTVNINYSDENGFTALHWAVRSGGSVCVARLLKDKKINVNKQDFMGWTSLHYASHQGVKEIVTLLIRHENINVNIKTSKGQTAVKLAKTKDIETIIKKLSRKEPTAKSIVKKGTFRNIIDQKSEQTRNSIDNYAAKEKVKHLLGDNENKRATWTSSTSEMKEPTQRKQLIGLKNHASFMLDMTVEGEDVTFRSFDQKPQMKYISSLLREDTTAVPTRRKGRTFLFGTEDDVYESRMRKSESVPVLIKKQDPEVIKIQLLKKSESDKV